LVRFETLITSEPYFLVRCFQKLVTRTLLCGCVYEETEWMLIRVKECERHHKARHRKVEYRPKAECNRNDTRGE